MRFLADGMFGKLTRWLRILGQDVEYSPNADDKTLLSTAKQEGVTLLTRDVELYKTATSRGIDAFFVNGKLPVEQLSEIARRFDIDLKIEMSTSRCPKCNTQVRTIAKEVVAAELQKRTFENYDEFWKCPKCGQVYWQGAHWVKIRRTLENARAKADAKIQEK